MAKKWKWGILGCGNIAAKFAKDLKTLDNAILYAASSRSLAKAQEFADQHDFQKSYGSYEAMLADADLDVVYVATPHSHHRDHTIMCLEHGKAVLCEKAFALNLSQAEEMIHKAESTGIFLMEAFWTRFQPDFLRMTEIMDKKELGAAKMMRSDFAFNGPYDPANRLYNLDLGGGSLLDIGIYPVFSALQAFGRPDQIKTFADFSPTGSEESISILFHYDNGRIASLQSSFAVHTDTKTEFWCEHGQMRSTRDGLGQTTLEIWQERKKTEETDYSYEDALGYHLEAAHVMDCLDKGLKESPLLPLSFSHLLMETLDRIRKDAGITFPFEQ